MLKVEFSNEEVQTAIKVLIAVYGDKAAIQKIIDCGGNLHARIVDGVLANTVRYLMKLRDAA